MPDAKLDYNDEELQYTVTVTDTQTGRVRTYTNPLGHLASFADTRAFPGG